MNISVVEIKRKIKNANLTQGEIAKKMGVSEVHLNGVLNGNRKLTKGMRLRISFAYDSLKYKKDGDKNGKKS
jgi:plasmid maintenance system antidote protein VapI